MKYLHSRTLHDKRRYNFNFPKFINAPGQPDVILPGLWGGKLKGFGSVPSNCFISSSKPLDQHCGLFALTLRGYQGLFPRR